MNPASLKIGSAGLTAVLVAVALAIGGGAPPDPARLASRAGEAADNLEIANRNIAKAVRDTEALGSIVAAVGEQLKASERLLSTQLEIERSSRSSADRSRQLTDKISKVKARLQGLRANLAGIARASRRAGDLTETAASSAERLQSTLRRLRARFAELIEESRELNRKARGYAELRDGPG